MGTRGFELHGFVVAPDGSDLHRITNHFFEYPDWSPDGSRITFMAFEPGASGPNPDYNIFVMNADGSNVTRLTDTEGNDGWPAWSPDGSSIVFTSARDDCSILRRLGLPDDRGHRPVAGRMDHGSGRLEPASSNVRVRAVLHMVAGRRGDPGCRERPLPDPA